MLKMTIRCADCEYVQDLDGAVQGPVLEVLGGLRAAAAALQQQAAEQTSLKDR